MITTETTSPPRVRWAAILWGAFFAAVAAAGIWGLVDDDRRAGLADWLLALTPVTITTLAILTIGVLVLLAGAAGLLRRMQRRRAASA